MHNSYFWTVIALPKYALNSISEAGDYPDGQFWAISFHFWPFLATYMVRDGPDCASIVHFLVRINVALTISALKSISDAGVDPDGQFWTISGHLRPFLATHMGQDGPG